MTRSSIADNGLDLLACVLQDGRLRPNELAEVVAFATKAYSDGPPAGRQTHAAKLLIDALVSSRGRDASGGWPDDDFVPSAPAGRIDAERTAAAILAADKKARGEAIVALPSDPTARGIVLADMRRRGDPPYRRAQSEPVHHIDDPTAVAAKIIAAAAKARGEK